MKKLYKFNVRKYGHNIFLCYNILRNRLDSKNKTEKDLEEFEKIAKLYSIMEGNSDGRFAYVTYDVWSQLTEYSIYAESYRARCNAY